jgi:HAMP domain-containing protein
MAVDAAGARPTPSGRPTTYRLLRRLLVRTVATPMLALLVFGAVLYLVDEIQGARSDLDAAASAIAREIESYLDQHAGAVGFTARRAAGADEPELQALVDDLRTAAPGFRTTFAADRSGEVVAASPDLARGGGSLAGSGASVAERTYFLAARDERRLHVSRALRGRGFGEDPIVAMAAPVVVDGAVTHVVEGSFDLSRFGRLAESVAGEEGIRVLVRDGDGRLVHDTAGALETLSTAGLADPGLAASARVPELDWSVRAVRWRVDVVGDAIPFLVAAGLLVVLGVGTAIVLASSASRRLLRPLDHLAAGADRLQLGEELELRIAPDAPAEFAALGGRLEETSRRLARSLSGLIPICASCKKVRIEDDDWVQVEAYVRDRSDADFSHGICPECAERYE